MATPTDSRPIAMTEDAPRRTTRKPRCYFHKRIAATAWKNGTPMCGSCATGYNRRLARNHRGLLLSRLR